MTQPWPASAPLNPRLSGPVDNVSVDLSGQTCACRPTRGPTSAGFASRLAKPAPAEGLPGLEGGGTAGGLGDLGSLEGGGVEVGVGGPPLLAGLGEGVDRVVVLVGAGERLGVGGT